MIDALSLTILTKLRLLHQGDQVEIRLLGNDQPLKGHIESLARGISDHDNPAGKELLSDVNPIFNWVRLAQRVPVRIKIDDVPENVPLVVHSHCPAIFPISSYLKNPVQFEGTVNTCIKHKRGIQMQPVWIAFTCGLFLGGIGELFLLSLLAMRRQNGPATNLRKVRTSDHGKEIHNAQHPSVHAHNS